MKPYYASDGVTLYHGDALDVLPTLERGSASAIITDPPYSSGGAFRSDRTGSTASKYLGSYNSTTAGEFPEVIGDSRDALGWAFWATLWLTRCYEVARPGAYLVTFSDWRQLPNCTNTLQAAGWVWRGIGVWDKGGSSRPMSGRFSHQAEYFPWGTKGAIGWDYERPSFPGVFRSGVVPSKHRRHQTEKPLEVMKEIVAISEGLVVDHFAGSGTTGEACLKVGRPCVLIELDERNCEEAVDRLERAARDQRNSLPFAEPAGAV